MVYENMTHTQIPTNYTENTYTKRMTYMKKYDEICHTLY